MRWCAVLLAGCAPKVGSLYPPLSGRVVDQAELVDPATEELLAARSAALEEATGAQLVVVTVASTGGVPIEDYARELGNLWQVGRRGADDGVLVVVSRDDRQVRIAVGDGLGQALTDAEAKAIIDADMVPRFAAQEFSAGLEAATAAIDREVRQWP